MKIRGVAGLIHFEIDRQDDRSNFKTDPAEKFNGAMRSFRVSESDARHALFART